MSYSEDNIKVQSAETEYSARSRRRAADKKPEAAAPEADDEEIPQRRTRSNPAGKAAPEADRADEEQARPARALRRKPQPEEPEEAIEDYGEEEETPLRREMHAHLRHRDEYDEYEIDDDEQIDDAPKSRKSVGSKFRSLIGRGKGKNQDTGEESLPEYADEDDYEEVPRRKPVRRAAQVEEEYPDEEEVIEETPRRKPGRRAAQVEEEYPDEEEVIEETPRRKPGRRAAQVEEEYPDEEEVIEEKPRRKPGRRAAQVEEEYPDEEEVIEEAPRRKPVRRAAQVEEEYPDEEEVIEEAPRRKPGRRAAQVEEEYPDEEEVIEEKPRKKLGRKALPVEEEYPDDGEYADAASEKRGIYGKFMNWMESLRIVEEIPEDEDGESDAGEPQNKAKPKGSGAKKRPSGNTAKKSRARASEEPERPRNSAIPLPVGRQRRADNDDYSEYEPIDAGRDAGAPYDETDDVRDVRSTEPRTNAAGLKLLHTENAPEAPSRRAEKRYDGDADMPPRGRRNRSVQNDYAGNENIDGGDVADAEAAESSVDAKSAQPEKTCAPETAGADAVTADEAQNDACIDDGEGNEPVRRRSHRDASEPENKPASAEDETEQLRKRYIDASIAEKRDILFAHWKTEFNARLKIKAGPDKMKQIDEIVRTTLGYCADSTALDNCWNELELLLDRYSSAIVAEYGYRILMNKMEDEEKRRIYARPVEDEKKDAEDAAAAPKFADAIADKKAARADDGDYSKRDAKKPAAEKPEEQKPEKADSHDAPRRNPAASAEKHDAEPEYHDDYGEGDSDDYSGKTDGSRAGQRKGYGTSFSYDAEPRRESGIGKLIDKVKAFGDRDRGPEDEDSAETEPVDARRNVDPVGTIKKLYNRILKKGEVRDFSGDDDYDDAPVYDDSEDAVEHEDYGGYSHKISDYSDRRSAAKPVDNVPEDNDYPAADDDGRIYGNYSADERGTDSGRRDYDGGARRYDDYSAGGGDYSRPAPAAAEPDDDYGRGGYADDARADYSDYSAQGTGYGRQYEEPVDTAAEDQSDGYSRGGYADDGSDSYSRSSYNRDARDSYSRNSYADDEDTLYSRGSDRSGDYYGAAGGSYSQDRYGSDYRQSDYQGGSDSGARYDAYSDNDGYGRREYQDYIDDDPDRPDYSRDYADESSYDSYSAPAYGGYGNGYSAQQQGRSDSYARADAYQPAQAYSGNNQTYRADSHGYGERGYRTKPQSGSAEQGGDDSEDRWRRRSPTKDDRSGTGALQKDTIPERAARAAEKYRRHVSGSLLSNALRLMLPTVYAADDGENDETGKDDQKNNDAAGTKVPGQPGNTGGGTKAAHKRRRSNRIKAGGRFRGTRGNWFALIGTLTLLFVAGTGAYGARVVYDVREHDSTFYAGIYLDDIALAGMSPEQAAQAVADKNAARVRNVNLTITYRESEFDIDSTTLDVRLDTQEKLAELWRLGHEGGYMERHAQILSLRSGNVREYTALSYDTAALDTFLATVKADVDREPRDASIKFTPNADKRFSISESSDGREVDITALAADARAALEPGPGKIELAPKTLTPEFTTAQAKACTGRLVTYSTTIYSKNSSRTANIKQALSYYNGKTVKPGEQVDFNKLVGNRTEARGFKPAPEYSNGEVVQGIGGGVCQASTTLYGALLRAGLRIDERYNHSMTVSYVPRSQDAAVAYPGKTLTFTNNTGYPVFFETRTTSEKTTVTIYGMDIHPGRTISVESEVISVDKATVTVYADPTYQYTTQPGQEVTVTTPSDGVTSRAYLVITDDATGKVVSRESLGKDVYRRRNGVRYRGGA